MPLQMIRNEGNRLRHTPPSAPSHLDSLDHGEVSRADLRAQARAAGVPDGRLLIPEDGEMLELA
jgi:hypothetical protein